MRQRKDQQELAGSLTPELEGSSQSERHGARPAAEKAPETQQTEAKAT